MAIMTRNEAKKRIEYLTKTINHHRHLYHTLDMPEISDAVYDSISKELFLLEKKYPGLVLADSPTHRVGGDVLPKFVKVRHEKRMLSFNDAFNEEDIDAWFTRLENYLGNKIPQEFYCELKIDGFAVELVYEDGLLVEGSTRGDGITGEDVTQNLKTISAIPLRISYNKNIPRRIIVRGEVFLNKKEFERINAGLSSSGKNTYANPRNLAAGSIRQLDPKIVAERKLNSFMYDIVTPSVVGTHDDIHRQLDKWGFPINKHNKVCKSLSDVHKMQKYWDVHRKQLSYEVDGLVVIANDNKTFTDAGGVGKSPRAAIAYKFTPEEATTVVRNISIQVGRTGILTPVAHLTPVRIGGVTVSHATLHNMDEIERLGVRIGDTVIITRSGDVIPKVMQVMKALRTGKEKSFRMPKACPVDGSPVVRDGVYYRCSDPRCGAALRRSIEHFVSRQAFNIDGVGGKIIDRFMDEGLITDAADLFTVTFSDIAPLSGFGEKSAENIIAEIESRKKISLPRFLYSLGILHIGEETSELLADYITERLPKNIKEITPKKVLSFLKKLTIDDLQKISDIGPKIADQIHKWSNEGHTTLFIEKLDAVGIVASIIRSNKMGKLTGKSFVLTGKLDTLSRDRIKALIKKAGGVVHSTVSARTNFVVAGDDAGSKLKRAQELGIKIIDEKKFLAMINT